MSVSKTVKKKLREGPTIEVDLQILRWREKRKKLGLYKPARPNRKPKTPKNPLVVPETPILTKPLEWDIFK